MARLLTGSINLSKIEKSKLFEGKTGDKYLNVSVWINDEVDQYGNVASVQQYMGKDSQEKRYIGNLKDFKKPDDVQEVKAEEVNPEPQGDELPW